MENSLNLYNALRRPPETALKTIGAGRLKGKSDINPQWRYESITKELGPCGVGWRYEIIRLWTEDGADGQKFAFAEIKFYIKIDGQWSEGIPGIGGSMMIAKESAGLHNNDEGYKMAVTDALSVAMKMIGTAADIYAGLWDGSKYKNVITVDDKIMEKDPIAMVNQVFSDPTKNPANNTQKAQIKKLMDKIKIQGFDKKAYADWLRDHNKTVEVIDGNEKKKILSEEGAQNTIDNWDQLFTQYVHRNNPLPDIKDEEIPF